MTPRCPSELALEAHLLDPERSPVSAHVSGCARCSARLAAMRAEGEDFARSVFPATLDAIEEAAKRRPWWRVPAFVLPIPAVAALAAVFLLFRPVGPADDYVGLKGGGGLGLTVFTPSPSGVAPVIDGTIVPSGASLRFRLRTAGPCHAWVASIDEAGVVSRLYPMAGERAALAVPGEQDLPGGAVLDGRSGVERVYAVCTPHPHPWREVEAGIRAATARPASTRRPAPLAGLPEASTWASVLLEKRP